MNGIGFDYGAPFGGMKASGNAREGGVYGLEEFCVIKGRLRLPKGERPRMSTK